MIDAARLAKEAQRRPTRQDAVTLTLIQVAGCWPRGKPRVWVWISKHREPLPQVGFVLRNLPHHPQVFDHESVVAAAGHIIAFKGLSLSPLTLYLLRGSHSLVERS